MNIDSFEKVWDNFIAKFKGKLLRQSNNGNLNYSDVKLVFMDIVLSWSIKTDIEGKWLADYTASNPEKGSLIKKILTEDLSINEIADLKSIDFLNFIIPVSGAVLGLCITSFCDAEFIIKAVSTVIPPIALYPATKYALSSIKVNRTENLINSYVSQLDKYKQSIISIIDNN